MKAVNLLPPDMRGAVKAPSDRSSVVVDDSNGLGAYALIGGLALAVLALAGVVLTGNAVKDREAELAGVKASQQQIAGRVAALKPYADFDQMAAERVATVSDLAGRRFDWEQSLRDLSRAIPADVTLSELTGNVSTDAGGAGGGGGGLRGAISAPAITIKGCTDNQREVARLMARMRNVDGVTRVSLAKSEKTDLEQGAGAGAAVIGDSAVDRSAPCGQGQKPEFEMIMFFEGDAEAATAPSATPPAPGQPGEGTGGADTTPTPTPAPGQASGEQSTPTSTGTTPAATPTPQGAVSP